MVSGTPAEVAHPQASRADGGQPPIIAVSSGKGGVGKSTVAVNRLPVMVTGAVPEQVAAYRSLARELDQRIGQADAAGI